MFQVPGWWVREMRFELGSVWRQSPCSQTQTVIFSYLEITITQGRGHSDLCRHTQALRKLKPGFLAAAPSMTQWLVSSIRASTQQKVFALRQGQKCFIDFIQDVYTWDQMTPVMEALKGSPALNERGPYFHLRDSVISSERWFVETVYKQMTSPMELPLPMPVMCVEARSPGNW